MRTIILFAVALAALCGMRASALQAPSLRGRVNDYAGILSQSDVAGLEDGLKAYEEKTSDQIAILTTRDLQGETIESYANQVFRAWKLGQKGKDNGILVVISVGDKNTARIEVGYGLEGSVPDAVARAIINDDMRPLFKQKRYRDCLAAGVSSIERSISGQYAARDPAPSDSGSNDQTLKARWIGAGVLFLVLLFIAAALSCIHRSVGGIAGAIGAFLIVKICIWSLPLAVVFAVVGLVVGLISKEVLSAFVDGGSGSSGGWGSSSDSSSSSSYSGGGGSSGGGGASGSLD